MCRVYTKLEMAAAPETVSLKARLLELVLVLVPLLLLGFVLAISVPIAWKRPVPIT